MKSQIEELCFPEIGSDAETIAKFIAKLFYEPYKEYGISSPQITVGYPYPDYYTVTFENVREIPFIKSLKHGIRPEILEIQVPIQKEEYDFTDIYKTVSYARENYKELLFVINRDYFFVGSGQIRKAYEDKIAIFPMTDPVLGRLCDFYQECNFKEFDKYLLRQFYGHLEGKC